MIVPFIKVGCCISCESKFLLDKCTQSKLFFLNANLIKHFYKNFKKNFVLLKILEKSVCVVL
jgi:hypothetical protein